MSKQQKIWPRAVELLKEEQPRRPVLFFSAAVLRQTVARFLRGFDGLVSYAVKANDNPVVLQCLLQAGITAFDVASPAEMRGLRKLSADAALHYNNPVRSPHEIQVARKLGVVSYAVDGMSELEKLARGMSPDGVEVAVRLHLPVVGAAWDFGEKFGERPKGAVKLLRAVAENGFTPSMVFHPGTQCTRPEAWQAYIETCAEVAQSAGVRLARLNVGGGFPSHRRGEVPDLEAIFQLIHRTRDRVFGADAPLLVCEPGRALVAESCMLATQIKSVRECGSIFLNDGVYGSLAEAPLLGSVDRVVAVRPDGRLHRGPRVERRVFGPTCDSIDSLPEPLMLPETLEEDDYVLFKGMGAYSTATMTRFNGYGALRVLPL